MNLIDKPKSLSIIRKLNLLSQSIPFTKVILMYYNSMKFQDLSWNTVSMSPNAVFYKNTPISKMYLPTFNVSPEQTKSNLEPY
jgi:hypothetical protein